MDKLISKKDKFFIAGANGMVGNSLYRVLKKNGYGLKEIGGEIMTPSKNELNLLNLDQVKDWFEINKPSVVILAAAKVGGILANTTYPTEFLLDNLKIQTNVIETAWKFGIKRFLFLGSSCIYPKYAKQPIKEEYLLSGELEETNQWYAIAKITGLKLCEALSKQYNFDAISLMPTNLYGPKDNYHPQNSHVMAALIKKFFDAVKNSEESVTCWGSGEPMREFMHVDDLAKAALFCLEYWDPLAKNAPLDNNKNPLYFLNVGTGLEISIKNLAEKIAGYSGFYGNIKWDLSKPDGTLKKKLSIENIKNLGWNAEIGLDQGLKKTIFEYKLLNS